MPRQVFHAMSIIVVFVLTLGLSQVARATENEPSQALHHHAKSVYVLVVMDTPPITDNIEGLYETKQAEWLKILKQEITKSKVFAELYSEPGADYTLKMTIKRVPPLAGWHFNLFSNMTLEMESEWTLVTTLSDEVIMKKAITTSHSDGASVMAALEKHQITKRGLMLKNIAEGLLAISQLKLD